VMHMLSTGIHPSKFKYLLYLAIFPTVSVSFPPLFSPAFPSFQAAQRLVLFGTIE
jgi:hypothetical protein